MPRSDLAEGRLYSRIYNFPAKIDNLKAKVSALRDEAEGLGFDQEAQILAQLSEIMGRGNRGGTWSRWGETELATLERLWRSGKPASEIAEIMGRTRNAILGAVWRHGLKRRRK